MNDETKRALESLRREMADGDPDWWKRERLIFNHIDGEPARLAAAREEQREALGLSRWPVLVPFIAAMVRKLDANKPKKGGREGWQNDDPQALLAHAREEVDELAHAVAVSPRIDILHEAADVANMAMMVADSEGAIRDTPPDATPLREALERANEGVRYWTDLAQAEARDAAALRARVAELEAEVSRRDALIRSDGYDDMRAHAQELARRAEKAEAQVAAARAECLRPRPCACGHFVLRAMDEAAKEKP